LKTLSRQCEEAFEELRGEEIDMSTRSMAILYRPGVLSLHLAIVCGGTATSTSFPRQTRKQLVRRSNLWWQFVFPEVMLLLFCLEAVVNQNRATSGMKFQGHVNRATARNSFGHPAFSIFTCSFHSSFSARPRIWGRFCPLSLHSSHYVQG
jgi:hypothetical protein